MAKQTQTMRVYAYMAEYGGITQFEAIRDLGCMRLASRISDLKRQGYAIASKSIPVKNRFGETCYIKQYSLADRKPVEKEEGTGSSG